MKYTPGRDDEDATLSAPSETTRNFCFEKMNDHQKQS
jgi:hypothetical protein